MPGLFDSITIGVLDLKNRIVKAPVRSRLATDEGKVTKELIAHYVQRAKGVGLIINENTPVSPEGRRTADALGIYNDKFIPGLKKLVEAVHDQGTLIIAQLNHAGARALSNVTGSQPVAPSAIKNEGRDTEGREFEVSRELVVDEIDSLVDAFAQGARRAVQAGFDGIELHGAHGTLINLFVSPLSNKRTDLYGGSLENRIRFSIRIITRVKQEASELPLFYRLGADDLEPGGITIEDSKQIARALVKAGVGVIDVSGGLHGSSNTTEFQGQQGYFVNQAAAIKQIVDVPVIAVGGITDPGFADDIVRKGKTDLVAIGRALESDPHWAINAAEVLGAK